MVDNPASSLHIASPAFPIQSSSGYRSAMNSRKPITSASLDAAFANTMEACRALNVRYPFSHTTALALLRIEQPTATALDTSQLHATTRSKPRGALPTNLRVHRMREMSMDDIVSIDGQYCLAPSLVWRQMVRFLSIEETVMLAESLERHRAVSFSDLGATVADRRIPYDAMARSTLLLVQAGTDSTMESKLRISLLRYGIWGFRTNYIVDGMRFSSGRPFTLDLALPELKIGIEYNGSHHRNDYHQSQNDEMKCDLLRQLGWKIFTVNYGNIANDFALSELAARIGRAIAERSGKPFMLTPKLTDRQLVDGRRPWIRHRRKQVVISGQSHS